MNVFFGWVEASNYQSVFQLGVAISLTYMIAGPRIREILREALTSSRTLLQTVAILQEEAPSEEMQKRQRLLELLDGVVRTGGQETVKVNYETTIFYVALAIGFFLVLMATSIFPHWPTIVAFSASILTGFAIFLDPVRVALNARQIGELVRLVHDIAGKINPTGSDGIKLTEAIKALSLLQFRSSNLKETIKKLELIRAGKLP